MRGEHGGRSGLQGRGRGSSPHARGTRRQATIPVQGVGIIPACAGNTILLVFLVGLGGDHPRMRGEHCLLECGRFRWWGSSPHARGTQSKSNPCSAIPGIIPACAGNTCYRSRWNASVWDHPRMRGEHVRTCCGVPFARGSSPHARGTLTGTDVEAPSVGIIPACAGNTSGITSARRCS